MIRPRFISQIPIAYWRFRWRIQDKFRRWPEALAYARNRMTSHQAGDIMYNCQDAAGSYPLDTLSVESCLEAARASCWQDHPELASLVQLACACVASKWDSSGHAADAAQDWALDLVGEFAQAPGIELTHLEDNPQGSAHGAGQHDA